MSFKDQAFASRFEKMGDEAEGHFEEFCDDVLGKKYVRFGLDRPPIRMSDLPTRLRYTPDYLLGERFVEVKGFGRDQLPKIKLETLNSLHYWNDLHPVYLYFWDSTNERETMVHLYVVDTLINDGLAVFGTFPEGKSYFGIPADKLFEVPCAA